MFGHDFYPTPTRMITKMLADINWHECGSILEPSAGKGDIALAIRKEGEGYQRHQMRTLDLDTIECDPSLGHILTGNHFRVVHDDFLTFETYKQYGLVVMNPPFSEGDLHLLKAIKIQERGGKIVCLLNAETIRNPFTQTRKDLARKLKELKANVQYVRDAFFEAERKTSVEIALVKIDVPRTDTPSIILDDLRDAKYVGEDRLQEEVTNADPVRSLVERYNFESKAGIALINEWRRLRPHMLDRVGYEYARPILKLEVEGHSACGGGPSINDYVTKIREKYWRALFADSRFTGILTSDVLKTYMGEIDRLKEYEFSLYNIWTFRAQFGMQFMESIDKSITKLFDTMSYKYHWHGENHEENQENVHYYNGWKTNKAWCIGRKVILPLRALQTDKYGTGKRTTTLSWSGSAMEQLLDIEKVFAYLEGKPDRTTSHSAAIIKNSVDRGTLRNIHTHYFDVTFFLKGTAHITFNDADLLKKFNIVGAAGRNWLPPSYGRTSYKDMHEDERAVVDSFEGEKEYEKTMARPEFYLVEPAKLLTAAMAA